MHCNCFPLNIHVEGATSQTQDVTLIQIDTALFSYELVLKGLQQRKTFPYHRNCSFGQKETLFQIEVVQALHRNPQTDLPSVQLEAVV